MVMAEPRTYGEKPWSPQAAGSTKHQSRPQNCHSPSQPVLLSPSGMFCKCHSKKRHMKVKHSPEKKQGVSSDKPADRTCHLPVTSTLPRGVLCPWGT